MKTSEKLDKVLGLLERVDERLDRSEQRIVSIENIMTIANIEGRFNAIEANMKIAHSVVREIGQAVGIMSDQVRELHSRFIELADDHGQKLRVITAKMTNGNGAHG